MYMTIIGIPWFIKYEFWKLDDDMNYGHLLMMWFMKEPHMSIWLYMRYGYVYDDACET